MKNSLFNIGLFFLFTIVTTLTFYWLAKEQKPVLALPAVEAVLFVSGSVCPTGFTAATWNDNSFIRFKDGALTNVTAATGIAAAGDHTHSAQGDHYHSITNHQVGDWNEKTVMNSGNTSTVAAHSMSSIGDHTHTFTYPYIAVKGCLWNIN